MSFYKLHSVKLHADGMGSAVILADVLSEGLQLDPELRAEITAGKISPDHVAIVARKLMSEGVTYDLPRFLGATGLTGLAIAGATNPGVVLYLQKFTDQGKAAASGHRSFTVALGLLVPRQLSADHQGDFRLTHSLHVLGDGTNAPVVISDSASLPTIPVGTRYTLGPVKLAGVTLTGKTNVTIDFGNTADSKGIDSDLDPRFMEQLTFAPRITITGIDPTAFSSSNIPVGGKAVTNAADYIYLQKRSQTTDGKIAVGTAEHIKLTPAGLGAVDQAFRAEMQRVTETSVVVQCATDSSGNAPLVLTLDTAIST